jgi:23S rRNA A2030 N6-methylase RlmJ
MYDHNVKAGNQGDVIKHTALISAASVLMEKTENIFHYADTFAGYAYNPLKSYGEWPSGIGAMHDSGITSQYPAVKFWQELWECKVGLRGSIYPGSSLFILKLCLAKGITLQARLWDISPTVIFQLMTFYDQNEVQIFPRPAKEDDFIAYKPDLLLIDPPDFKDVNRTLILFDLVKNIILWLPVVYTNGSELEASRQAFKECQNRGLPSISVSWQSERNTRGCRLIFQLPDDANRAIKNTTHETAKLMGWAIDCID